MHHINYFPWTPHTGKKPASHLLLSFQVLELSFFASQIIFKKCLLNVEQISHVNFLSLNTVKNYLPMHHINYFPRPPHTGKKLASHLLLSFQVLELSFVASQIIFNKFVMNVEQILHVNFWSLNTVKKVS